jgi:hypothetical protein
MCIQASVRGFDMKSAEASREYIAPAIIDLGTHSAFVQANRFSVFIDGNTNTPGFTAQSSGSPN